MAFTKTHISGEDVPYWNQNIPQCRWTTECPSFLVDLGQGDITQLAMRDEDYHWLSWEEVEELISTNRLEVFKRLPSDLRRYRAFNAWVKQSHGSMLNFILKERVQWNDLTARGNTFQYPEDIKILHNDWPYGIDPAIVHLVVWTKFGFEEDPATGDLTPSSRKAIDNWVWETFGQGQKHNKIVWFKNWAALKSVHSIEHFHVMLLSPDPELMRRLTDNQTPLARILTKEELFGWATKSGINGQHLQIT